MTLGIGHLIYLGVELNSFEIVYSSMLVIGSVLESFGLFDMCFAVYSQIISAAELTKHRNYKVKALIRMAKVCLQSKLFTHSLKLFMKSIEHTWMIDDLNQELKIYDLLGYNYYIIGDIPKA